MPQIDSLHHGYIVQHTPTLEPHAVQHIEVQAAKSLMVPKNNPEILGNNHSST